MPEQVGDHIDAAAGVGGVAAEGVAQLMRADARAPARPAATRRASSSPIASGRIGAPIGARNRFTNTKSPSAACGTLIRSNA